MRSNNVLVSVAVFQTEISSLVLRLILFTNGLVDVDGVRTTGAPVATFMTNSYRILNKRVRNYDTNRFEIDFDSNDVLGSVEFYLTTERFVIK